MPAIDTMLAFWGVATLLALSPGPDNLFVLVHSAQHGWRSGLAVVVGLCGGLVLQTTAVALGLAALFVASETAFNALKWCGAAYLLWLALGALRAACAPGDTSLPAASNGGQAPQSGWRMLRRGVIMNITNPKVLVFFLAFLPQFTNPERGSVALQVWIFGALFMLSTLLVFGAIAWFSGAIGAQLRRSDRVQRFLNGAAGLVFVGLAVNLVLAKR